MYSEAYHLQADPFRLSPDERFCFRHKSFARNKAYLDYALERGEGFVMITGAPGSGKTTLLNDVLANADKSYRSIARIVTSQLDASDLLRMVAYSFGIKTREMDKASLLHQIEKFLINKFSQSQHSLLIIDEAQALNKAALEEIRLLTNLQINSKPLLQVFLVGQNKLLDLIQDPDMEQLHQRVIASSQLEPMKVEETEIYVIHRLRMAGWDHDPLISRGALRRIHLFSQGVPRIVNQLCSRLLLYGSVEDLHRLDSNDVHNVINELHQEHLIPLTYNPKQEWSETKNSSDDGFSCDEYDLEFPDASILNNIGNSKIVHDSSNKFSQVTDISDFLDETSGKILSEKNEDIMWQRENMVINLVPQTNKPDKSNDYDKQIISYQKENLSPPTNEKGGQLSAQETLHDVRTSSAYKQPDSRLSAVLGIFFTITLFFGLAMFLYPQPASNKLATSDHQSGSEKREQQASVAIHKTRGDSAPSIQHSIEQSLRTNALQYKRLKQGLYSIKLNVDEQFGWGSAIMSQELQSKISQVAQVMRKQPNTIIHIIGFCDPSGSQKLNLSLSRLRSKVVANYLALKGIPQHRLTTDGRGSSNVINANDPRVNRRVELLIESVNPVITTLSMIDNMQ